ncbi:MAG: hypothetical protein QM523_04735 [Candidatus Pacebacteria bacterium]|nr:hypothetical protein [Candidatus Paceibacterota bacterium]
MPVDQNYDNRLKITLVGRGKDGGDLRLNDFIDELKNIKKAILASSSIGNNDNAQNLTIDLDFKVTALSMNSPAQIEIECLPKEPKGKDKLLLRLDLSKYASNTIDNFVQQLKNIENGKIVDNFDYEPFEKLCPKSNSGIVAFKIESIYGSSEVTTHTSDLIYKILGTDLVELGSVRGDLHLVNIHSKEKKFIIYPVIGAKKVSCYFDDSFFEKIKAGLDRFVEVSGKVYTKNNMKFPYKIEVEAIDILPNQDEIPLLSDLMGVYNRVNYGGKNNEEYLAERRDGWE